MPSPVTSLILTEPGYALKVCFVVVFVLDYKGQNYASNNLMKGVQEFELSTVI